MIEMEVWVALCLAGQIRFPNWPYPLEMEVWVALCLEGPIRYLFVVAFEVAVIWEWGEEGG